MACTPTKLIKLDVVLARQDTVVQMVTDQFHALQGTSASLESPTVRLALMAPTAAQVRQCVSRALLDSSVLTQHWSQSTAVMVTSQDKVKCLVNLVLLVSGDVAIFDQTVCIHVTHLDRQKNKITIEIHLSNAQVSLLFSLSHS